MINMYSHLLPLVKDGKKTATTRYGIKQYPLGDNFIVDVSTKEQVPIRITKIEHIQFSQISLEVAQKEDYQSLDGFKHRLQEIYGPLEPDQIMTVIHFKLKCPFCEVSCGFEHCPYN